MLDKIWFRIRIHENSSPYIALYYITFPTLCQIYERVGDCRNDGKGRMKKERLARGEKNFVKNIFIVSLDNTVNISVY